ncbi:hypothetical protein [Microbacterium stercoris]|uniref:Glycosyltransferase family 1 protein n=1 Tax=Microbacterium stercoris TaxID=2820289 RepID=A0A939TP74_9MICO|nr:hypothetical protein [Microbacterium stercoris]MBO3664978.1 hypothetical protein [Microbacterium stercoris]
MTGPSVAHRIARAVVRAIPDPIADRVVPWRRRAFAAAGVSSTRPAERRLLIGPVNSAGQGYAWARAAETLPDTSACDFMYRGASDAFRFPADHSVPTPYFVHNKRWQRAQRRAIIRGFTHVLIESGRGIYAPDDLRGQIADLTARGVRVGLLFHGSDIRIPSLHAQRDEDSPFRDDGYEDQEALERVAQENHRLMAELDLPVFVSTPDLLEWAPRATLLPVVVEPERWRAAAPQPPLQRERPVVVHAPSRAGLKGTALVEDALQRMHADGRIELRLVSDIPAAEMPALYGRADIVLDQFGLGIYGVAACEAFAAGRLVISRTSETVRAEARRLTGQDLPIVESRGRDIVETLERVIADRERFAAIAARGPVFVDALHSGAHSARVLEGFLAGSGQYAHARMG